jgi:hypothetical protein
MVLPQGFRDSPQIFSQALKLDLNSLNLFPSKLIQYVDDLPLCSPSKFLCKTHTVILLNSLAHWGYQASKNKFHLISTSVSFMGLLLTLGYHQIPQNRRTTMLQISSLKTKRDSLCFLGLTGYFKNWIPNYSIIAKPLDEAARGDPDEPLPCPRALLTPSNLLKQALSRHLHSPSQTQRKLFIYIYTKTKAKLWAWWPEVQEIQ